MIDSGQIIPTILGGLISGLVGVGLFYVRSRAEEKAELNAWYQRTIRLAGRIERADKNEYTGMDGWYARSTCAGVLDRLAKHVENSPARVDEDVLDVSEELLVRCQHVIELDEDTVQRDPKSVKKGMEEAAETASNLIKISKSSKT